MILAPKKLGCMHLVLFMQIGMEQKIIETEQELGKLWRRPFQDSTQKQLLLNTNLSTNFRTPEEPLMHKKGCDHHLLYI